MNRSDITETINSLFNEKYQTGKNLLIYGLCMCGLLILLVFCWTYKLSDFPGLHGDEAWSGLKAYYYLYVGIDKVHGMNNYTGILQPLSTLISFKLFGINVVSLRICGIFFNLAGLVILLATFWKISGSSAISFLLIMLQSALLISAPRIAWEVNTFTLFFISIMAASVFSIARHPEKKNRLAIWLFLIFSLLGSYNHILFSCISLAGTIALIFVSVVNKKITYKKELFLFLSSILNQSFLFIGMYYFSENRISGIIGAFFFPIIIYLQTAFILKFSIKEINFPFPDFRYLKHFFLITAGASFVIFHGHSFFDVLTGYRVIAYLYAIDTSYFLRIGLSFCGCFMAAGIIYFLYLDIFKSGRYPALAYTIVVYAALLPLYTQSTSYRYYLAIYILIAIYMACHLSKHPGRQILFWPVLFVSGMLLNIAIFKSFDLNRPHLATVEIPVGQGQKEQSVHFYSKAPIIDFLIKNRIGRINYPKDRYFIEQPILFYHLIAPWQAFPSRQMKIELDPSGNNKGFKLIYEH